MATNSPITNSVRIAGLKSKTNIRLQQIARYRITGRLTDQAIADRVGLSLRGLQQIIVRPEYKELEDALLEGHISRMDEAVAGNIEELKATMEVAVPLALRTLVETVQQRRDLRAAMSAASEILDRDPERTFAKTSKNAIDPGAGQFNPGADTKLIASLTSNGNAVAVQIQASSSPVVNAAGAANNIPSAADDSKVDGLCEQHVPPTPVDAHALSTDKVADA